MESWTSLQTRYLAWGRKPAAFTKLIELTPRLFEDRPSTFWAVSSTWSAICKWLHNLGGYLIMKLTSNTILITGGGGGIGYELTKQLTELGNTILITGRDQAKMDRAKAAFPQIHTFRSDVSDPKAIALLYEEVTKQFPEHNILINNAGTMREINLHDKAGSLDGIPRELQLKFSGPPRMVQQLY